ncbi:PREDICTED: potassium/sodium hyperpolarization-activated cyclic nucleotide-gated channel 2-like [Chinchilla lanigera]|uniref:potassium/sodium hyperpolarization-activated cyclic nucleotide-gated channel 2-like n=1 Tax=Chinchilla lanigera TaxID=34839 RepID=UPI000696FFDD|nr:PREDICTED: potassium/sodium hyperpolarization-activated cyclic nucleotide-gated channel 2-like [Chinchilla lanigera]
MDPSVPGRASSRLGCAEPARERLRCAQPARTGYSQRAGPTLCLDAAGGTQGSAQSGPRAQGEPCEGQVGRGGAWTPRGSPASALRDIQDAGLGGPRPARRTGPAGRVVLASPASRPLGNAAGSESCPAAFWSARPPRAAQSPPCLSPAPRVRSGGTSPQDAAPARTVRFRHRAWPLPALAISASAQAGAPGTLDTLEKREPAPWSPGQGQAPRRAHLSLAGLSPGPG